VPQSNSQPSSAKKKPNVPRIPFSSSKRLNEDPEEKKNYDVQWLKKSNRSNRSNDSKHSKGSKGSKGSRKSSSRLPEW